jgi:hypothetical protein
MLSWLTSTACWHVGAAMTGATVSKAGATAGTMVRPLALAQFIASYAATATTVAISSIAKDLGTNVAGVQTAITLFTLTMAALMIPGSMLTDIWGRKRCFILGLIIYGTGAFAGTAGARAAAIDHRVFAVRGRRLGADDPARLHPDHVAFPDIKSRARYFGVVSGAGGSGAAAGPLIGGLITWGISWRASFGLQVLVVAWIIWLARKITDPPRTGPRPRFDLTGAMLSAVGLLFVVLGPLQSRTYGFGASRTDFTLGNTVVIPKGSISPLIAARLDEPPELHRVVFVGEELVLPLPILAPQHSPRWASCPVGALFDARHDRQASLVPRVPVTLVDRVLPPRLRGQSGGGGGNRTRVLRRLNRASPGAVCVVPTRPYRSCTRAGTTSPVAVGCPVHARDRRGR